MKHLKSSVLKQIRAYVNFQDFSEEQAKELHYLRYLGLILVDTASPDAPTEDWQAIIKSNHSRVVKPPRWKSITCPGAEVTEVAGVRRITVSFWVLKKPSDKDLTADEHRQPFSVRNVSFAQVRPA